MNWLLKLLPQDKRDLLELGQRVFANLDTAEERAEVLDYFRIAIADGRISVIEWSIIGSKLQIYKSIDS
jgi:uncharacterized protein Yka (UPF0111/DUF47 family)